MLQMLVQRTIHSLLRRPGVSLQAVSCNFCFRQYFHQNSSLHSTESDVTAARKWLAELHEASLPSNIGEVSYSRSSGPGGQNVNKSVSSLSPACSF